MGFPAPIATGAANRLAAWVATRKMGLSRQQRTKLRAPKGERKLEGCAASYPVTYRRSRIISQSSSAPAATIGGNMTPLTVIHP